MSIKTIQQVFSGLKKLTKKEKNALADFERRIGILYRHKKQVREIVKELGNLKKQLGNRFKDKEKLSSARDSVLDNINKLLSALNTAFSSLKIPEIIEDLTKEEETAIQKEIDEELHIYKSLRDMDTNAANKLVQQLAKIVALEKTERDLVSEFEKRINDFRKILASQAETVRAELELLRDIKDKINEDKIISTDIDSWCFNLQNHHKNIERLLKAEKEVIHEPLYKLVRDTRRATRLGKRYSKESAITIDDIKQDIQTFSKPEEYTFYYSSLRTSGMLPDKAAKFLDKAMYRAGIAGEEKSFAVKVLKKLAFTDQLTKLNNRYYFKKRIKEILDTAIRTKEPLYFTLLIMDIDHFKKFNDTYGHDIGDDVLKNVAAYIRSVAKRESDIVIRWGGEEFVVLLRPTKEEMAKLNKATAKAISIDMANRIRKTVEEQSLALMEEINARQKVKPIEPIPNITISIGLAMYPEDIIERLRLDPKKIKIVTDILLKRADRRLYKAKKAGRNCIVFSRKGRYVLLR